MLSLMPFLLMAMIGTLMTLNSNSWFLAWMGLEINLMAFIPLLTLSKGQSPENAISYFLIQSIGSSLMLFSILLSKTFVTLYESNVLQIMVASSLMLKSGVAPLHFWFPSIMEGSSWINCLLLSSLQKVAPTLLLIHTMSYTLILMAALMSILIGSIGGLNQMLIKKLLAYSSITHSGWAIMSLMMSNTLFITYAIIYALVNSSLINLLNHTGLIHMNQLINLKASLPFKMMVVLNLLSLGGLPPFTGFLPKMLVIRELIKQDMTAIALFMATLTLVTLFYYIKMNSMIISTLNTVTNWDPWINLPISYTILPSMSILGLIPLSSLLYYSL